MKDTAILLVDLLTIIAKLLGPGGAKAIIAENLLASSKNNPRTNFGALFGIAAIRFRHENHRPTLPAHTAYVYSNAASVSGISVISF